MGAVRRAYWYLYRRRFFGGRGLDPSSVLGLFVMQNSDSGAFLAQKMDKKEEIQCKMWIGRISRDHRLRVSSPYFLYLYVQKYKSVASVGPPVAVGPCALHTLHTLLLRHCVTSTVYRDPHGTGTVKFVPRYTVGTVSTAHPYSLQHLIRTTVTKSQN